MSDLRFMVDLYGGIGGASLGFRQAGFDPVYYCDADANARLVYFNNFFVDIGNDIKNIKTENILHPEIAFASPPDGDIGQLQKVLEALAPRAIILEYPERLISSERSRLKRSFKLGPFKCWHGSLNSNNFGLVQKRAMFYIVGFREDVNTPFLFFRFPEPTNDEAVLGGILESNPDPKLFFSEERMKAVEIRNEKNRTKNKTGFRTKIYTAKDTVPSLPISYWKDYRGIVVDSGNGPRHLSVLECKRLMGFPDNFKMPIADTRAMKLLARASCPPMIQALAEAVSLWL